MTFLRRIERMTFATLLLVGLYACSWMIPDYWMNKVINEPLPSYVMVRVYPQGHTCANKKEVGTDRPYRDVVVYVDFVGGKEPEEFTIYVNDSLKKVFRGDTTFEFMASPGVHRVKVIGPSINASRGIYVAPDCEHKYRMNWDVSP
jgi:hypothetical protein